MHPDGTVHDGTVILIKDNIKHYEKKPYCTDKIQATNIIVEDRKGPLMVSAIYSPPKHNIKKDEYEAFFSSLGRRFLAGGDFNAKHTHWSLRVVNPKGRQLLFAVQSLRLNVVSPGKPTYWPTDFRRVPNLMDLCVIKGIPNTHLRCDSSTELSSDHSPVSITLSRKITLTTKPCKLHNHRTDWTHFK